MEEREEWKMEDGANIDYGGHAFSWWRGRCSWRKEHLPLEQEQLLVQVADQYMQWRDTVMNIW
jgi:hypothetical protein